MKKPMKTSSTRKEQCLNVAEIFANLSRSQQSVLKPQMSCTPCDCDSSTDLKTLGLIFQINLNGMKIYLEDHNDYDDSRTKYPKQDRASELDKQKVPGSNESVPNFFHISRLV